MGKSFSRKDAIECVKDGVLEIPSKYDETDVDFAFFVVRSDLPHVRKLIIPSSITNIQTMRGDYSEGPYGYKDNPFEEIQVSRKNPNYASAEGVLFTKNMDTLISYPCGKTDLEYRIPEETKLIETEAFLNVENLKRIYFHGNVEVKRNAFSFCDYIDMPDVFDVYMAADGAAIIRIKAIFNQNSITIPEDTLDNTLNVYINGEECQILDNISFNKNTNGERLILGKEFFEINDYDKRREIINGFLCELYSYILDIEDIEDKGVCDKLELLRDTFDFDLMY